MNSILGFYKWLILSIILFTIGVIGVVISINVLSIGTVYIWAVFFIATFVSLIKSYAEVFIPKQEATI
jgi:NADH:ubiquinone oxidoreductase subunit K